jgi:Protein of unknown function (DUF3467)
MAKGPTDDHAQDKPAAAAGPDQARVRWNTSQLRSSYCNVANATSTREEVVLNFGVNQNWDRMQQDFEIELQHRIILSPFAAKRLSDLLAKLVKEYESRYGELK